ncbi:hypothetical protein SO802_023463 [Lithocarpus litseifolius]|uniref:Reverse transcriptase zinc-binding domain-containing protein n=1 Tax=Lithocarpus litseifolius TaxID=425828 RepID=A0AAW2C9R6_9ROSI
MANGKFTVKSAYHLAVRISSLENRGSASDCSLMRRFWRSLWRLPIPHKVRHFAWRACREALPTKVNLKKRKVLTNDSCEWCKVKLETAGYALWGCPKAQEMLLAKNVNLDCVSRLVMVARKLWHSRNEWRLNGVMKSGKQLVFGAMQY